MSFFVCGVQKGGTTSLQSYLIEHPQLSPPSVKEIHFFDDETQEWGDPDYGRLEGLFDQGRREAIRFDNTPIYAFWPPSIERIARYNPAAKLVFLFRDPFERAWSQWCMEYARGTDQLLFADALAASQSSLAHLPPLAPERRVSSYVERGEYGRQVRRALSHFGREQLLFLRSEDLRDDPAATLGQISGFLNIAPFPNLDRRREHTQPDFPFPCEPREAELAFVAERLRDDLEDFARLTGLDVANWPTVSA